MRRSVLVLLVLAIGFVSPPAGAAAPAHALAGPGMIFNTAAPYPCYPSPMVLTQSLADGSFAIDITGAGAVDTFDSLDVAAEAPCTISLHIPISHDAWLAAVDAGTRGQAHTFDVIPVGCDSGRIQLSFFTVDPSAPAGSGGAIGSFSGCADGTLGFDMPQTPLIGVFALGA